MALRHRRAACALWLLGENCGHGADQDCAGSTTCILMLHPLDPPAGMALLLLAATTTQDDSAAQPAGQEPTSSRQDHWQVRDEEPSVRCRMSGICDGAPPPVSCADSPPPDYRSLGAAERDAVLACITDPGQRAAEIAEAAAWSWQGYRRVGSGGRAGGGGRGTYASAISTPANLPSTRPSCHWASPQYLSAWFVRSTLPSNNGAVAARAAPPLLHSQPPRPPL